MVQKIKKSVLENYNFSITGPILNVRGANEKCFKGLFCVLNIIDILSLTKLGIYLGFPMVPKVLKCDAPFGSYR